MCSLPEWAQWIARANPMMHFIALMRAVLLKGAGFADVAGELGVLALAGAVVLTVAVVVVRKLRQRRAADA